MPASDRLTDVRSPKLLNALFWGGIGLAPVAVLILFVAESPGTFKVAVFLAVAAFVLIGLSQFLRRDGSASLKTELEDTIFDEVDQLRADVREDINQATRGSHRALSERMNALAEGVDALRAQIEELRVRSAPPVMPPPSAVPFMGAAGMPHPGMGQGHPGVPPGHGMPGMPGPGVVPGQAMPGPGMPAGPGMSPVPGIAQVHGMAPVPGMGGPGVVRHTETFQVTRHTTIDSSDDAGRGTVYGSRAVDQPFVPEPHVQHGPEPSREAPWEGMAAGDRWMSVRTDDQGRELRMGERRAAVRNDGSGTEMRVEDRWAAVRRPDDTGGSAPGGRRRAREDDEASWESTPRRAELTAQPAIPDESASALLAQLSRERDRERDREREREPVRRDRDEAPYRGRDEGPYRDRDEGSARDRAETPPRERDERPWESERSRPQEELWIPERARSSEPTREASRGRSEWDPEPHRAEERTRRDNWDRPSERARERSAERDRPLETYGGADRDRPAARDRTSERDRSGERPIDRDRPSERPADRDRAVERPVDRDRPADRPIERDRSSERPDRDRPSDRPTDQGRPSQRPDRDPPSQRPDRDPPGERPDDRDWERSQDLGADVVPIGRRRVQRESREARDSGRRPAESWDQGGRWGGRGDSEPRSGEWDRSDPEPRSGEWDRRPEPASRASDRDRRPEPEDRPDRDRRERDADWQPPRQRGSREDLSSVDADRRHREEPRADNWR